MSIPTVKTNQKRYLALIVLILIGLVIAVYGQILSHQFLNWDDDNYVVNNTDIKAFGTWMLTSLSVSNWHPLTWFSYTLDHSIFGLSPRGFHFSNLILHGANTLLVFAFFNWGLQRYADPSSVANRYLAAFVASALFAIHPQHVEVVAWVSERKELLCFFFSISSLWLFLISDKKPKAYLWSLGFFFIALTAKAMAVTLPLLFWLIDYYRGKTFWRNSLEKLPFLLLSLVIGLVTIEAQHQSDAIVSIATLNIEERLLNAIHSLGLYLQQWSMPIGLSPFYSHPRPLSWHNPQILAAVIITGLISAIALWQAQHKKYHLLAVWGFYIITLLPVLGLLQVGAQASADRYAYLPTLGFYALIAWALVKISWQNYRTLILTTLLILAIGFSLIAYQQTTLWQNDYSLWRYAVLQDPKSITAHVKLANSYKKSYFS